MTFNTHDENWSQDPIGHKWVKATAANVATKDETEHQERHAQHEGGTSRLNDWVMDSSSRVHGPDPSTEGEAVPSMCSAGVSDQVQRMCTSVGGWAGERE